MRRQAAPSVYAMRATPESMSHAQHAKVGPTSQYLGQQHVSNVKLVNFPRKWLQASALIVARTRSPPQAARPASVISDTVGLHRPAPLVLLASTKHRVAQQLARTVTLASLQVRQERVTVPNVAQMPIRLLAV
jgi:hypothetical protein